MVPRIHSTRTNEKYDARKTFSMEKRLMRHVNLGRSLTREKGDKSVLGSVGSARDEKMAFFAADVRQLMEVVYSGSLYSLPVCKMK